ncbi:small GTPase LIP1 isoform X2 [Selaginella moellendorffii]|uniref:small GTPase LIP1 isoform X2 n=1 Tax=Selaginella moellendorffii TaxID=88036 RepID=UPI000D1C5F42|nr:small GTPase LIP1 isoform X2 [Selaginella moellendorffii]|eukprot:XP_024531949.1 small GTPase LIP1 isoform X2 [Selaginella moellendorffii]
MGAAARTSRGRLDARFTSSTSNTLHWQTASRISSWSSGTSRGTSGTRIAALSSTRRSMRKTKSSLQKWAREVASLGHFSAPLPSSGMGLVPVPFLVIGNKADIAPKAGGSSGNLVDAARHWVEKQGLLSPTDELPTSETFPGTQGLRAAAKDGELDMEAIDDFFSMLIRRRYFGEGISTYFSSTQSNIPVNSTNQMPSSSFMYNGLARSNSSSRYRL